MLLVLKYGWYNLIDIEYILKNYELYIYRIIYMFI